MMLDCRRVARTVRAAAFLTLPSLALPGCGGESAPDLPLVPLTGTVTLEGTPLAQATMGFVPAGTTPGGGGKALTNAEGVYAAETAEGKAGLPAGEYTVVISRRVLPKGVAEPPPDTPPIDRPDVETVPPPYSDYATTPLKVSVKDGTSGPVNFELKADKKR